MPFDSGDDGDNENAVIEFSLYADGQYRTKRILRKFAVWWADEDAQPDTPEDKFLLHSLNTALRSDDIRVRQGIEFIFSQVEEEALADRIREAPGTRGDPFWWLRLQPKFGLRNIIKGKARRVPWSCHHGMSALLNEVEGDEILFESEATYLDRNGLLSPQEKRRVRKEFWEPELWKPWQENRPEIDRIKAEIRAKQAAHE